MTRKKTALITLAAALLLSISVVGSLMLFTDMTPTATNTIEFGAGIQAKLVETIKDDQEDKDIDSQGTGENDRPTIDFGHVAPGQILDKRPKVVRTDKDANTASDAYVAVKATIEVYEDGISVAYDALENDVKLQLADFFDEWIKNPDSNWVFLPEKVDDKASPSTGYFFYVNSNTNKTLKVLPPQDNAGKPSETPCIFQEIAIPSFSGEDLEIFASLQGKEVRLKLYPWLVQSDNNPYDPLKSPTDYPIAFAAFATFEVARE
jgi:hypothetical protein